MILEKGDWANLKGKVVIYGTVEAQDILGSWDYPQLASPQLRWAF